MSFDEEDVRRALDERSGEPSPEYRARLRQAVAASPDGRRGVSWMAPVAVIVVTLLTATSVGALVAYRHSGQGGAASAPRGVPSVSPFPSESPVYLPGEAQLSAPSREDVWLLLNFDHLYRSVDAAGHWERRPLPQDAGVRPEISFIDDREGWLLAPGSPTTQCQEASATIWHTTDAGASWQKLSATGLASMQCKEVVYFADPRHGFVTAWDDNHRPTVYSTADGGYTWRGSTLPDGPLFVTRPGGFTLRVAWIKKFGSTIYLEAAGMQMDPNWAMRSFIYTSRDGGATWSWKQKLVSSETVMVTESRWLQYAPDVEESVDEGQAFSPYSTDFAPLSPALGGTTMLFADSSAGYATGRGELEKTGDGGAHWVMIPTPGTQSTAPSPTPSPIPLPGDVELSAPSANTVWALVNSSYLFRSLDQGRTWSQRTFPQGGPGGIPAISFVDDFHGYALFPGEPATQCTEAGASLYATSDGAATWNLVSTVKNANTAPQGLPFEQCKDYVYFLDPSWGFVVGHDNLRAPVISTTQDGGKTWSQSTLPDPPGIATTGGPSLRVTQIKNFVSVMLLQASGFTATGEPRSFVYSSPDGGRTWSYAAAAPSILALATATRWLSVGNDGTGQETLDGGRSWHAWPSDYQDAAGVASTFVFATPQVGYGTVRGAVRRTVDGGTHWELIKSSWP